MSVAVFAPGSKSVALLKEPTVYIFPKSSTLIDVQDSSLAPSNFFAQPKLPAASNFAMKTSKLPVGVRLKVFAPGSKSATPLKYPVTLFLKIAKLIIWSVKKSENI